MLDLSLDGIVIATPRAMHAEQTVQALVGGAAVFCQKPLERNAEEVRSAIGAARAADRLLAVNLSYCHTAAMRAIRADVQTAELCREHGISDATFYSWKAKYGEMTVL